jgi:hypothetical protein
LEIAPDPPPLAILFPAGPKGRDSLAQGNALGELSHLRR